MSDLPEWTPGPGTYPAKSDFVKKVVEKVIPATMDEDQHIELVPAPDQKGNA